MTLAVGIITGVLTGVASAALFWWWQAKLMRPKLLLCRTIAYYRLAQDRADRYQIKIMNGRRRPAVDLRVTVSIHLPGLLRHSSVEILLIHKFESPFLDKAITYGIQPSHMPQDTQQRYLNYLPADLAGSIRSGEPVDLEEFFKLHKEAYLRVDASAMDSFSGASCLVRSKYGVESIKAGRFAAGKSCEHTDVLEEPEDHEEEDAHWP